MFHTWEYCTWGKQDIDEEGAPQALELTSGGTAAPVGEQRSVRMGSPLPGKLT